MEAIDRFEKRCKENTNGSEKDKPFFREERDGHKWRHVNGRWVLVWPRPLYRPKELKESSHSGRHRRRHHKPVVKKTELEAIPEGLENELETKSEPESEPEPVGPYTRGTCWWLNAPCLDDLEKPAARISNAPCQHELLQSRRPSGLKNLFLESFRCCVGQSSRLTMVNLNSFKTKTKL